MNSYPNIEVSYSIDSASSLTSSLPISISITLDRESDDSTSDSDLLADAPHFPHRKLVSWWLVIGDAATKALYAIKKVTVRNRLETKLEWNLNEGEHRLKLYLICDSYVGADQDFDLEVLKVAEGDSEEEESDEEEGEGEDGAMEQD